MSVLSLILAAGCATSAMAGLTVTPSDVICWGQTGSGTSLAAIQPAGLTWSFFYTTSGQGGPDAPVVGADGRVYFVGTYRSSGGALTGGIGTANSTNNRGLFTGTNSTDLSIFNGLYDAGTYNANSTTYNLSNIAGTVGGLSGTTPRISGNKIGYGLQISGGTPAVVETPAASANNTLFGIGDYAGGLAVGARQLDSVTVKNTSGVDTAVNHNINMKSISQQNSEINSSGTMLAWMAVPAVAGSFVATANATAAPFGNTAFLATKTVGGGYEVVAQGGQSAPGVAGGVYQNGGNGINGFFSKINRNGDVAFDGKLCTNFPVSTSTDQVAYIKTPGNAPTLVYREGQPIKDAAGNDDAGGALWGNASVGSGGITTGSKSFSNAGMLFSATSIGGDTITTAGATQNDSALYIATTTSTTRLIRRGDQIPGQAVGVNFGIVNFGGSNAGMNNNGFIAVGSTLQGAVIANVNPVLAGFPPTSVGTAGTFGNDQAIIVGTAGNLQAIVRNGDPMPGSDLRFNFSISSAQIVLNNANQLLFATGSTLYAPGDAVGVAGGPLSSILPAGPNVLMSWSPDFGLVPMLTQGQSVEVAPGVFKNLETFNVTGTDNGDGGSAGLNDSGRFAVRATFTDTSWGIIYLQIPAPGTGLMALLGLGAMARRRRN